MVRYIGMDVHREFAQLAVVEDGLVRDEGRIGVTPEALRPWAEGLRGDDQVALEATGNSDAIANLLTPLVGRVVVSNPSKTRAIAEAKVKTDKVDARILAQLLAADFLPPVWLPDERTRCLRRQVIAARTWCANAPGSRTRFTRSWPATWPRPRRCRTCSADRPALAVPPGPARRRARERARAAAAAGLPRQRARGRGQELAVEAFGDPVVARLMTIPGVDAIAAISTWPLSVTCPVR